MTTRRVRGSGSLFRKGNSKVWTLQFYKEDPATGRRVRVREATGLTSRAEAQRLLTTRLYQIDKGEVFETRRAHAVRIADLFAALQEHYLNNRKTGAAKRTAMHWRQHLQPVFGNVLAANLTTDAITAYIRRRQEQGAANATVNRELAGLRRALRLGRQSTPPKVRTVPYIPFLQEDNARRGFVEDADYTRLAAEAGELWLRLFLELAFTYGWRKGELLGLQVRHVDLQEGTIRLDPGSTKNREGREVRMTTKVTELLRLAVAGKQAEDAVLTRPDGKPVRDFRKAWRNLCERAGLPGLLIHDLRRSAAKALRRAGVPESVVMQTGGWKTAAMFRRYAIVSSADQRDAVERLEQARAAKQLSPRSAPVGPRADQRSAAARSAKVQ